MPPPAKNGGAGPPNSGSALVDLVENMLKAAPPAPGAGPAPKQGRRVKAKAAAPPATEDPAEEEEDDPTDREPN